MKFCYKALTLYRDWRELLPQVWQSDALGPAKMPAQALRPCTDIFSENVVQGNKSLHLLMHSTLQVAPGDFL